MGGLAKFMPITALTMLHGDALDLRHPAVLGLLE